MKQSHSRSGHEPRTLNPEPSSLLPPAALGAVAALAAILLGSLFLTGGLGAFDFWWWMGTNSAILIGVSLWVDRAYGPLLAADARSGLGGKLLAGLLSAAALYAVFWAGNHASRALFGAWAGQGIQHVYDFKAGAGWTRIVLLIGMLIGPAEEIFWRGFLQRHLAARWGRWTGFALATALYAGVHLSSGNPMLVLAAGVCGVFWGALYLWRRSVVLNVVSHVVWDLSVFAFFPLTGP